jgi:hypothetical protein
MGKVPLLMYTGTSTEYWTRAASPLHTNVAGTADAAVDPRVRIYFIAGGQHGISASRDRVFEHPPNPLDHSPPLRALLRALDRWATDGTAPPPSVYPRIDRGELVPVSTWLQRFPKIPGARLPSANLQPARVDWGSRFRTDGILGVQPPALGPAYVTLVPAPDADGNDRGGIALPDVSVPLATFTGWNLRTASRGASAHLARWSGSRFPFAVTEARRRASGDPRPSLEARYRGHHDYVRKVTAAAAALRAQGFLLDEDAHAIVTAARTLPWPPPE